MVEKTFYTGIHNPVMDIIPISPGSENSLVDELLQLIGYSLGLHGYGLRELGDAHLLLPHEGVEKAKSRVVCQDLEESHEAVSLICAQEGNVPDVGFRGTDTWGISALFLLCHTHDSINYYI